MTKRKFVPTTLGQLQSPAPLALQSDASDLIGESWDLWQGDVRRQLRCYYGRDCGVDRQLISDAVDWTVSELLADVCDRFARGLIDPIWLTDRGWWLQQTRNVRRRWFDVERASQCRRYRDTDTLDCDIAAPDEAEPVESGSVDATVRQLLALLPESMRGAEWIVRTIVAMGDNPDAPAALLAHATECTEPTARKRKQRLRDLLTVGALFNSVSR